MTDFVCTNVSVFSVHNLNILSSPVWKVAEVIEDNLQKFVKILHMTSEYFPISSRTKNIGFNCTLGDFYRTTFAFDRNNNDICGMYAQLSPPLK